MHDSILHSNIFFFIFKRLGFQQLIWMWSWINMWIWSVVSWNYFWIFWNFFKLSASVTLWAVHNITININANEYTKDHNYIWTVEKDELIKDILIIVVKYTIPEKKTWKKFKPEWDSNPWWLDSLVGRALHWYRRGHAPVGSWSHCAFVHVIYP